MSDALGTDLHLTGANPEVRKGVGTATGGDVVFARFNINTPSTSATCTIYKGPFTATPSTTGTKVAVIDCSTNARTIDFFVRCPNGIYAVLTPAATGADCTVVTI